MKKFSCVEGYCVIPHEIDKFNYIFRFCQFGLHILVLSVLVCYNANFPGEQEGLKSRGALLFDQFKRTGRCKLRVPLSAEGILCFDTCLFLQTLGLFYYLISHITIHDFDTELFQKNSMFGHFRWKQYLA